MRNHPLLARALADDLIADRVRDARRHTPPARTTRVRARSPRGLASRAGFALLRLPHPAPAPDAC